MTITNIPESPLDLAEPKVIILEQSKQESFSDQLTSILNRLHLSPETLMLFSAFLIGGTSGLAMVIFHLLIDWWENFSFNTVMGQISVWGHWTLALIPALGGLIVGLMRWRTPEFLGHGFSALLSNVGESKISPLRPAIKMLAAAISLGSGASLGPEGPSVEIGSNIGIILGQGFQVSQERYRLLLGAGAAAGIAAGFNAPIAGVFFALEVVLGTTFTTPAVSLILLSAVVSAVISHLFLHVQPAFELPDYQVVNHWEWIFYLGLGLLASLVSIVYTQSIKFLQACFQGEVSGFRWLKKLPLFAHPVLGGVCVGVVALYLPHILGIGYGTLQVILEDGSFPLQFLCFLLLAKLFTTAVSLGSGFVGGIFAPALFLGACLGAIYGNILGFLIPSDWFAIGPTAAYAMVGMAAVLAGSVRAPLTAILLLFELTRNYLIILPLMAAVGVSVWVVEQIKAKQAVEGLKLPQMGLNLEKPDENPILSQMPISALMDCSYLSLPASLSLVEAGQIMLQTKCHTALVTNQIEELIGVLSLNDIKRKLLQFSDRNIKEEQTIATEKNNILEIEIGEFCTKEILCAYEHESVTKALERMTARGLFLLPVVSPDNPRRVLGIIEKNRISLAGELATTQELLNPYLMLTISNLEHN